MPDMVIERAKMLEKDNTAKEMNLPEETVHDCEKEMTAFIADIPPKTNLILVIRIPEKICLNSFHQKLTIW